jgi:hypothetical protein
MSNLKLREVIKQIRQCKTAAEERAVISKESALIRNAFKVSHFLLSSPTRKRKINIGTGILPNCYSSISLDTLPALANLNALNVWALPISLKKESDISDYPNSWTSQLKF